MARHLLVTESFDGYAVGAHITDAPTVNAILAGPHANHVSGFWASEQISAPPAQAAAAPAATPEKGA